MRALIPQQIPHRLGVAAVELQRVAVVREGPGHVGAPGHGRIAARGLLGPARNQQKAAPSLLRDPGHAGRAREADEQLGASRGAQVAKLNARRSQRFLSCVKWMESNGL